MEMIDSPLMGAFIGYIKDNWGGNSRENQRRRRRRLRQLVDKVRAVVEAGEKGRVVRGSSLGFWLDSLRMEADLGKAVLDAPADPAAVVGSVVGSAKKFLAGIRSLFVSNAEVDRLTDAVQALESLSADLDAFLRVLELNAMGAAAAAAAPYLDQGSYSAMDTAAPCLDQGSYSDATAPGLPVPGSKRKRAEGSSGVYQQGAGDVDVDGDATSHRWQKRRALPSRRYPQNLSSGRPPSSPGEVATALNKYRRRIGRPNLGRTFSAISLQ